MVREGGGEKVILKNKSLLIFSNLILLPQPLMNTSMFKRKKTLLFLLIIIVIIGGYAYSKSRKPKVEYVTATVEKGDLAQTVSVTGKLVADEEISLDFETVGRVEQVLAREAREVSAGQALAVLNSAVLAQEVAQKKAQWEKAMADAKINDDEIREAKVAKENAENVLDKTKDLNDQTIAASDQDVDDAEDYKDAVEDYYNKVAAEEGGSSSEAKSVYATLINARGKLNAAKEAKKTEEENADLSETNARNSLDLAEAKLKSAESKFLKASNNAVVESARAAYEAALAELSKSTLVAPVDGVITKVNGKKGEIVKISNGDEPLVEMISRELILESNVPESDIVKVALGQKARVVFDSLSADEEFEAEIVEIDPASTVIQDVVYYTIKLKLTRADSRLKPGMSADIDVKTLEKKNILIIPSHAVKREGIRKYVEVQNEKGAIERKQVQTGVESDEGVVEVKSGVREGEKVIVFTPTTE